MKKIDIYDFDGTIYNGDSTVDYLLFCISKHPSLILLIFPIIVYAIRLMFTRDLTVFKSQLFSAFAKRVDLETMGRLFWEQPGTRKKINEYIYHRKKDLPVVIASASPDFQLRWAGTFLGIDQVICTTCDPKTGKLIGKNCKSSEKIRKIENAYGPFSVRAMYTDNPKADGPLLELAEEKYLVTNGTVTQIS